MSKLGGVVFRFPGPGSAPIGSGARKPPRLPVPSAQDPLNQL